LLTQASAQKPRIQATSARVPGRSGDRQRRPRAGRHTALLRSGRLEVL